MENTRFLPISKAEMQARGWDSYDFLVVSGDAYVDHPSFGPVVIARTLEAAGYRVAFLAQPQWKNAIDFQKIGRPKWGVLISAGNLDSMVAHYTAAKKKRSEDFYSPGKKMGLRPDRATMVYANFIRGVWPGLPIIIGGLEASLRRFAHYDYWEDKVRRSILFDAKADLLVYGMGEHATREIAARLASGTAPSEITDVRGTAYIAQNPSGCVYPKVECASFETVIVDKTAYAKANKIQYDEHDPIRGRAVIQRHGDRLLIVNPPAMPLTTEEFDAVAELPYTREVHPMYDAMGGVPAIEEVRFSVIHNRGCIGACNFCSLAYHQGRMITSRSHASIIREVTAFTKHPLFKGYVHDVGGPTANFRHPSCAQQLKNGMCKNRSCLAPTPCKSIDADHSDYLQLLRELREIPGIKKVFVRSGIRFDYMMLDKNGEFFAELVKHHISGQLKVAPEHCIDSVLDYMGKPHAEVYEKFQQKYAKLNGKYEKDQFLVPYLMSSHPGSTLQDAVKLAEYLHETGRQPEQVQDFYPTPGTLSTCMYYTGIDPRDMKQVYVARDPQEKALQRALLQWKRPEKRRLVLEALRKAKREDLIGFSPKCLVRPEHGAANRTAQKGGSEKRTQRNGAKGTKHTGAAKHGGTSVKSNYSKAATPQKRTNGKRKKP